MGCHTSGSLLLMLLLAACACAAPSPAASPDPSPLPAEASPSPSPKPAASPRSPAALASSPAPASPSPAAVDGNCPPYTNTAAFMKTNFSDKLNTTVAVSPKRPNPDRPAGAWIPGRATYYGTSKQNEDFHVSCGEPAGQFGILEQGACGFTNSDGSLVYAREAYAAAASANIDYPGSCGRCYEVRCRTGVVENNGRPLQLSDLIYMRPLPKLKDSFGRTWPGNPLMEEDLFYVKCWDDNKTITIRIADSCPCKYQIKDPPEIRTQYWCCGGGNHLDLSYFGFELLAHPAYGVMPLEYRPVDCDTKQPLDPVPGFISRVVYDDDLRPGWGVRPYLASEFFLLSAGAGLEGGNAMCATLSPEGAVAFFCRECSRPGYQPFSAAATLRFFIRSNTPADADAFASSTPAGQLPGLNIFLKNDEKDSYCGAEVGLGRNASAATATKRADGWFLVSIPLAAFACERGSTGSLEQVDRVDFQNTAVRDAQICLDNISLAA